ncbi:MAG: hypothetical protein KKC25_10965, partial [Proteobacteria bacterium]|nr:hypothetical protein [Pseudomonadota bacterium]
MTNKSAMASVGVAVEDKPAIGPTAPLQKAPALSSPSNKIPESMTENLTEEVIGAITAIEEGPKVLKLYMEMCA